TANKIRQTEFAVGINGSPSPCVAPAFSLFLCASILRLRSDKAPDFVTLETRHMNVTNGAIVIVVQTEPNSASILARVFLPVPVSRLMARSETPSTIRLRICDVRTVESLFTRHNVTHNAVQIKKILDGVMTNAIHFGPV